MEEISKLITNSLWEGGEIGYYFSASKGSAGGLLIMWRTSYVSILSSFCGNEFLGIKVSWKSGIYYIVNIYSSCSLSLKRVLWRDLLILKNNFTDGDWLFGGDFNAVKTRNERVGSSVNMNATGRRDFSIFIDSSGLVDVPCKGRKYSWYSGDGRSKSRIDRFLVSDSIVSSWGVAGLLIGLWDVSDHCPVWLEVDKEDWGPKPFKFNNEWFSNKDFLPFVEKHWKAMVVRGRSDFVLK
ncbi:uncharacterized protein LOC131625047 [Vicia villosa]|uniref:uncharacterized protein LOC131625047 n=1 Tax=Vicia villosa TaxID=3911 RepID=UPI00273B845E|nr:uncharacterized protein LOC131625047 [Vicia villosa]